MSRKMSVNSKAQAARPRKSAAGCQQKERHFGEIEGFKSRTAKKREEEAQKKAEAIAKRAEARRLAELEEKEIDESLEKHDKKGNSVFVPTTKVTEAELQRRREAEMQKKAEAAVRRRTRTATKEEYARTVLVTNTNRVASIVDARTVEDAIAQMSVAERLPIDRHPERRLKASFKVFEDAKLPILKDENPGLTFSQYKERLLKLFKKSPENPFNKVALQIAELMING